MPLILLKEVCVFVFSTDEERTHFSGALCGLGPSSESAEGLLADNDIELAFDIKIDTDDISEVSFHSTCAFSFTQKDRQTVTFSIQNRSAH